ncbi:hypothetical protein GDO86_006716 [Hymenochirus boettgeri]|uniref:Olfactory receptor n=2 Tax=Hymenochirus boettgeri TaxID=247094 RepID=A0A8T2JF42_9PIPI|nr:hypothetical protein GDO86_006716 [Hymenochirus boettgeri]
MFHLLALSTSPQERFMIFTGCFLVYSMTVLVNLLIISLVYQVSQLHTSMYFFLCNLSVLDILYTSSTLPKLLFFLCSGDGAVSYNACIGQLYFFLFCADTESFLLTSMAVDRYVAICKPLQYSLIMDKKTWALLAVPAWCMAAVNSLILTKLVTDLSFCGFNQLGNFFCDLKALLSISCSDTLYIRTFIRIDGMFVGVVPCCITIASYSCIISAILKIKTSEGRLKAFSSCSSHISVVILFYASALSLYMRYSQEGDMLCSVMFVTLVPMLNPLIYSLRNKDIHRAMKQ